MQTGIFISLKPADRRRLNVGGSQVQGIGIALFGSQAPGLRGIHSSLQNYPKMMFDADTLRASSEAR